MLKGEHWAKRRAAKPRRICAECGGDLLPKEMFRSDGSHHSWFYPKRYCSLKCTGMAAHKRQLGKARGRFIDKHGYVLLTNRKGDNGYQQPEHRAVMEKIIGRKLRKDETVHHKNGIRSDNRPENLELWLGRHGRGQRATEQHSPMAPGVLAALDALGVLTY